MNYKEIIKKIKQLLCRHKYCEMIKKSKFYCISGQTVYIVC